MSRTPKTKVAPTGAAEPGPELKPALKAEPKPESKPEKAESKAEKARPDAAAEAKAAEAKADGKAPKRRRRGTAEFEDRIGYRFKNPALLEQALTHISALTGARNRAGPDRVHSAAKSNLPRFQIRPAR